MTANPLRDTLQPTRYRREIEREPFVIPAGDTYRDHLRDAGEIVAGVALMALWIAVLFLALPVVLS